MIHSLLASLSSSPIALMIAALLLMVLAGLFILLAFQSFSKLKRGAQRKRLTRVLKHVLPQFGGTVHASAPPFEDTYYISLPIGSRVIELREYELAASVSVPGQVDSTFLVVPFEQNFECVLVHKEVVYKFFQNYKKLDSVDCGEIGISDNYILFSNDLEQAKEIVTASEFIALIKILDQDYKNSYLMLVPTTRKTALSEQFAFHFPAGLLLCRVGLSFFLEQKEAQTSQLISQLNRVADALELSDD